MMMSAGMGGWADGRMGGLALAVGLLAGGAGGSEARAFGLIELVQAGDKVRGCRVGGVALSDDKAGAIGRQRGGLGGTALRGRRCFGCRWP